MQAGGATDEYTVRAGDLNVSFVGQAFGYNASDGSTVYGRIAALVVRANETVIVLAGVPAGHRYAELTLNASEPVYLSHSGSLEQIELYLADTAKGR